MQGRIAESRWAVKSDRDALVCTRPGVLFLNGVGKTQACVMGFEYNAGWYRV